MEGDEKGYWKNVSEVTDSVPDTDVKAKRRVRILKETPEYYFLPKSPLPRTIAYYGAYAAVGLALGMVTEVWIKKKIKEEVGGEFEK